MDLPNSSQTKGDNIWASLMFEKQESQRQPVRDSNYSSTGILSGVGPRNIVMVGRVGNGKSASGNTIIGERVFESRTAMASVTQLTKLESVRLDDGKVLNVIDTPGLFDPAYEHEKLCKEIVKCLDLVRDGIHAVLLVYKINDRFSQEEEMAIDVLKEIFGPKIIDYMIIVLTGVDMIDDDDDITPEEYLNVNAPCCLRRILYVCRNRYVFFNNREKNEERRKAQVHKLLELVEYVIKDNEGEAFSNKLLIELQKRQQEAEALSNYYGTIKNMEEVIEKRIQEGIEKSKQRLIEQLQTALKIEASNVKIRDLEEQLNKVTKKKQTCTIM